MTSDVSNKNLLLIGCGKMGLALLSGWSFEPEDSPSLHVVEPDISNHAEIMRDYGATVYKSIQEASDNISPDIVIIAVKPQVIDLIQSDVAKAFGGSPLYISVAAGKNIAYYQSFLGDSTRIIRAMPNTPATISRGISGICPSATVLPEDMEIAVNLFSFIGIVIQLDNEQKMDAITAISGSGPAYVFYFMECLQKAAIKAGFDDDTAYILALETVYGSAALAENTREDFSVLRKNVTSPSGTTEAALGCLMKDNKMADIVDEAVSAAITRSQELSK